MKQPQEVVSRLSSASVTEGEKRNSWYDVRAQYCIYFAMKIKIREDVFILF